MGTRGAADTTPYEQMIQNRGEVPSFWQQRVGPCPNTHDSPTAGFSPGLTCPLCGGTGTVYRAMTLPTGGKTGGKVLRGEFETSDFVPPIDLQAGDLFGTWLDSEYPLAEGDRLGWATPRHDHAETLVRGAGAGDNLRLTPALSITVVYTPAGVLTPAAYALSSDGRQILFSGGSAPAAGTQVLVRYRWSASYLVAEGSLQKFPEATNGDSFPTLGVLRLWNQSPVDRKAGDQ